MLQVVKEQCLDYDTFISTTLHMMKEIMGEEYLIQIHKVIKNNSLELDSLVVLKEGKNFTPNIYLLPYYESYSQGTSMQEIISRLCSIYQNYEVPVVSENFAYTFEEMKDCIIYRVVNYEKNKKLLSDIPHRKYLDLAITYHCLIRNDENGIGTIRITTEHMKQWKTEQREIELLAIKNTPKLFPLSIRSMEEVIKAMLKDEFMTDREDDIPEEFLEQILNQNNSSQLHHKMYILSNKKGINGATCMLYENAIRDFAFQNNSDLFILPSSIHEIILIPKEENMNRETLVEMVKDVNCTQVAPDEVLSDQVYIFSRKNNCILL